MTVISPSGTSESFPVSSTNDSDHAKCGGVFFDSVALIFASCANVYSEISDVVNFHRGNFEISIKSNSVRTRGPREAKFPHDVGVDVGTCCTRNGVAAMHRFAARWR